MKLHNFTTAALLIALGVGTGVYIANSFRRSPSIAEIRSEPSAQPADKEPLQQTALQQLLETKNCPGCDLTAANLAGMDLEGANLQGANLIGANLENTRLKNANLRGANLLRANLAGADFGCVVRVNRPNDSRPSTGISVHNYASSEANGGFSGSNSPASVDINVSISRKRGTIDVDADDCTILDGANLKEARLPEGVL